MSKVSDTELMGIWFKKQSGEREKLPPNIFSSYPPVLANTAAAAGGGGGLNREREQQQQQQVQDVTLDWANSRR